MSDTDRDPAKPTREELLETARSEGIAFTEEETDPDYVMPEEPAPGPDEPTAPQ